MKSKIKPYEKVDVAAKKAAAEKEVNDRIEKMAPGWKSALRNIPEQIKTLKFEVPFKDAEGDHKDTIEFGIEDSFIEKVKKEIPEVAKVLAIQGMELTRENEKKIIELATNKAKADYFGDMENITKLLAKQRSRLWDQWTEQRVKEDSGVSGITGKERPASQKQKDHAEAEVAGMKQYLELKKQGKI